MLEQLAICSIHSLVQSQPLLQRTVLCFEMYVEAFLVHFNPFGWSPFPYSSEAANATFFSGNFITLFSIMMILFARWWRLYLKYVQENLSDCFIPFCRAHDNFRSPLSHGSPARSHYSQFH